MTDISNISDGTNIYALKDSNAVHKTDDEIINGTKTFLNEINGYLKSYCATNGSTNTYPYKKLGECVLSGAYQTLNIPFLYVKTNSDVSNTFYQGKIILRIEATAGTLNEANSGIILNIVPNYIINDNISFYICYKNNTPTTNDVTCQIWTYVKTAYSGVCILPIRQGLGNNSFSSDKMTWGNNLIEDASLPSDYTSIKHTLVSDNIITPTITDDSTKIATTAFVKAQGYTSNTGTITGITMNNISKGTSGVVDLGTVATSDTKNTAGSTDTSSKIFLVGATSQAANPQTYSHDTVFVNTSGQLESSTPASSTNSTVVATTAFVKAQGYSTTDTKNTAGSTDTSSKIFLVGATSQAANPQTYSHDTVYVNTSGQLVSATPSTSTNSTVVATTAYVKSQNYLTSSNLTTVYVVTEKWTSGTSWYRVWSDGFIEQCNQVTVNSAWQQVTLKKAFTTTNYHISGSCSNNAKGAFTATASGVGCFCAFMGLTKTTFNVQTGDDSTFNNSVVRYYACGF